MRPQPIHPLLFLLARATQPELIRQVQFLKVENRMLRSRLPRRVVVKGSGWRGRRPRRLSLLMRPRSTRSPPW